MTFEEINVQFGLVQVKKWFNSLTDGGDVLTFQLIFQMSIMP
jgi:hypothetical protein